MATRKRPSRRKLLSSASFWKPAPAGFNEKYGLTGDFLIPKHIKRPSKRTLTLSKPVVDDLRQARGAKRSRAIAKAQRSIENVSHRVAPINERQAVTPKLPTVKRAVPVVRPDGYFDVVRMTGAALAQARDRAEAIRRASRNPRTLESYNSRYADPSVIGGHPFIVDRDALTNAKKSMTKGERKKLDKLYAEMFVD